MARTLLCLATKKGLEVLRAVALLARDRPLVVCTFRETNVAESYIEAIKQLAAEHGLPILSWGDFRNDPIGQVESLGIHAILCIGWRYLIPDALLDHLGGDVVIAHDSLLPKYRGFAPLVTAMIAGENETGVTFLRAAPGVDTGPILWQRAVSIGPGDTVGNLIERLTGPYVEGSLRYLRGELTEEWPQDTAAASYCLWRDLEDYIIDWTEDAPRIERTIRALGPPYLGARTHVEDRLVVIHRAEVEADLPFAIRQPGKVWALDSQGRPTVVCGCGLLKILEATTDGTSIMPLEKLRLRFR
jgi:methionyl-tRNA formyltransferase